MHNIQFREMGHSEKSPIRRIRVLRNDFRGTDIRGKITLWQQIPTISRSAEMVPDLPDPILFKLRLGKMLRQTQSLINAKDLQRGRGSLQKMNERLTLGSCAYYVLQNFATLSSLPHATTFV